MIIGAEGDLKDYFDLRMLVRYVVSADEDSKYKRP